MTFVLKNGKRVLVIRPRDPALALKLAQEAVGQATPEQFDAILAQQPYTVVGFLGRGVGGPAIIVDADQKKIGETEAGDSIIGTTDELLDQLKPGDPFVVTEKPAGQA